MSTALAEREAPSISKDELDLVRRTVANGATDAELKLFLFDCQRRGVHPLDKLLHFTKRGGKYTPVTSIDFMRSQAAMSGEMAGSDDAVFFEGEQQPIAATVTVYRMTQGQRFAYTATARWSEYCPDNAPMWKRMGHTMLAKCAEALALRKAFPQQLAGLYSREEMDQAETPAPTHEVGEREKPSAANGGEIAAPFIDTETGEERPTPPAGYHYIHSYSFKNGWHNLTLLNFQSDGGGFNLSTKKDIGYIAGEAFSDGLPVKVEVGHKTNSSGEGWLNAIEKLHVERPEPGPMLDAKDLPF